MSLLCLKPSVPPIAPQSCSQGASCFPSSLPTSYSSPADATTICTSPMGHISIPWLLHAPHHHSKSYKIQRCSNSGFTYKLYLPQFLGHATNRWLKQITVFTVFFLSGPYQCYLCLGWDKGYTLTSVNPDALSLAASPPAWILVVPFHLGPWLLVSPCADPSSIGPAIVPLVKWLGPPGGAVKWTCTHRAGILKRCGVGNSCQRFRGP